MTKQLSKQIAGLSVRARKVAVTAQKEAHDMIVAGVEQARAAATKAAEKVAEDIASAGDKAAKDWRAVRAKIARGAKA